MPNGASHSAVGRAGKGILVALGLAASAYFAERCVARGVDFLTMWAACRFVLRGEYIYKVVDLPSACPCPWPNPPVFIFTVSPLGLLDARSAGFVWFYAKLALVVWLVREMGRFARRRCPSPRVTVIVPTLLAACWFSYDFTLGHMNVVSASLLIAGLLALLERSPARASLFSALAICAKGPAALVLVFFAARREWRVLSWTLMLCVVLTFLPAVVWGPARTWQYTRDFVLSVRLGTLFTETADAWQGNWGLPELTMRLLGQARHEDRYGSSLELVRWSHSAAVAVAQGITTTSTLLLVLWWSRRPGWLLPPGGFAAPPLHQAGVVATGTLLLAPLARKAHFPILLLPYFVLWGYLASSPRGRRDRGVAVLFALALALSSLIHADLWGRALAFFFERWHAPTASLLVLLAAQLLAAHHAERVRPEHVVPPPAPPSEAPDVSAA